MRPERILSELRKALPADGFVVTDVGWNKNGVAQQFPITVSGTFVTPSGLATMGFGSAAVLGVKTAQPHRAAVCLIGDGGFSTNPSVVADRNGSESAGGLAGNGQHSASAPSPVWKRCTTAGISAACFNATAKSIALITLRWLEPAALVA